MRLRHNASIAGLALSILAGGGALSADTTAPMAPETPQTVSIVFKLRNTQLLENYIQSTVDLNGMGFSRFLSTHEFAEFFGPLDWQLNEVLAFMGQNGITVNEVYDSHMIIRATGTASQFSALLATNLVWYWDKFGHRYQKCTSKPKVPTAISDIVLLISGLDTTPAVASHTVKVSSTAGVANGEPAVPVVMPPPGVVATGTPGSFTVGDVINLYNIAPLYAKNITGKGTTLGIATLASFTPSDAFTYWSTIGLTVDPTRITVVPLDGGTGTNGADETTLDVQQSGGLAPGAKIMVYEAPNTDSGFIDLFYKAISDNKVDTLSVSWGSAEVYLDTPTATAYHQVMMEAAAQGIPVFASSGDSGAFDVNRNYYPPFYSAFNSVDHPASDPYVTAAGGTTLPYTGVHLHGSVTVPQERPWGWDYLESYLVTWYGQFFYDYNYFPVGGGGGVSTVFDLPHYQKGLAGVKKTPSDFDNLWFYPNYTQTNPDTSGAVLVANIPPGYAGRNVPDVSLNADPYTGYLTYFNGVWQGGWGGTSFVAPQLNGIASLLTQAAGHRIGFLNPQFYQAYQRYGYGPKSPFHAITTGDNLYWMAAPNYNPASGLGTLDVTKLEAAINPHWH